MSHVDNAEHDFDGLEGLDPVVAAAVKDARIEARTIIDTLEPRHISSLADLRAKLMDAIQDVDREALISEMIAL